MVSRRSFLQAVAAALAAPIIDLRQHVPRENLMLNFCDQDYMRYNLQQPFGHGSLTYATDSLAMIRTELLNRSEVGEMRIPPVDRVWHDHWNPIGQWRELDDGMLIPTITREYQMCPKCCGERVSYGEAFPPYPDSEELARLHHWDPDDNMLRNRSCDVCHGLDYECAGFSDVLGVHHSSFMLKRIAALPNAMVCRSASVDHAVLFRADGFEGISLGCSDKEDNE